MQGGTVIIYRTLSPPTASVPKLCNHFLCSPRSSVCGLSWPRAPNDTKWLIQSLDFFLPCLLHLRYTQVFFSSIFFFFPDSFHLRSALREKEQILLRRRMGCGCSFSSCVVLWEETYKMKSLTPWHTLWTLPIHILFWVLDLWHILFYYLKTKIKLNFI